MSPDFTRGTEIDATFPKWCNQKSMAVTPEEIMLTVSGVTATTPHSSSNEAEKQQPRIPRLLQT